MMKCPSMETLVPDNPNSTASQRLTGYSFAIEVEMVDAAARTVRNALRECDRSHEWRVRSIRDIPPSISAGLSSPVLKGSAGMADLRRMLGDLQRCNEDHIGRVQGLHVYMSCNWTPTEVLKVISRYVRFEREIEKWVAAPCNSLRSGQIGQPARITCPHRNTSPGGRQMPFRHKGQAEAKYVTLGATRFRDPLRTWMEFRQHFGTTCPDRIEAWIKFLAGFINTSRSKARAIESECPAETYRADRHRSKFYSEVKQLFGHAGWNVECRNKQPGTKDWWFVRPGKDEAVCLHYSWLDWFYHEGAASKNGVIYKHACKILKPAFMDFFRDLVGTEEANCVFKKIGKSGQFKKTGDSLFDGVDPQVVKILKTRT